MSAPQADVSPPGHTDGAVPAQRPDRVRVAVHNGHCHKYAVCQQEAPEVFSLRSAERLSYDAAPPAEQTARVRQAARLCPVQAITVHRRERRRRTASRERVHRPADDHR